MKLSSTTIIIMAVSIAVAILSFGLFHQWFPTQEATRNYAQYKEQLNTEANKRSQADRRVAAAKTIVRQKTAAWNAYAQTRTPAADVSQGGVSLAVNPYQLAVDTQKFRNAIQKAVNIQVKKGGIKIVGQGPVVRGPSSTDQVGDALLADFYNYPGIQFPVVIFDFGTVTVSGTYEQILANVKAYKTMPRYLAVTDGLTISGTSPNLTGTYNLSIVGFIRGKEIFPTAVNPAGAAAAPGATGASQFPAGVPGGMGSRGPSGPPGMPPGMGNDR